MITSRKNIGKLLVQTPRVYFSKSDLSSSEASDVEAGFREIQTRIDPVKGEVVDFLKHVNLYEEQNLDVIGPYYMEYRRLPGLATTQGTNKYYSMS
jgi:hypothetical protein